MTLNCIKFWGSEECRVIFIVITLKFILTEIVVYVGINKNKIK